MKWEHVRRDIFFESLYQSYVIVCGRIDSATGTDRLRLRIGRLTSESDFSECVSEFRRPRSRHSCMISILTHHILPEFGHQSTHHAETPSCENSTRRNVIRRCACRLGTGFIYVYHWLGCIFGIAFIARGSFTYSAAVAVCVPMNGTR